MKIGATLVVLVAITGCSSMASRRQGQYELERKDVIAKYYKETILPRCDQSREYPFIAQCPEPLSLDFNRRNGDIIKRCGLTKNRAKANKCSEELNQLATEISAKMTLRYKYADWTHVQLECDSKPGTCDQPLEREMIALVSHNERVQEMAMSAVNQYDKEYANEVLRNRATNPNYNDNALSAGLKGMASGLNSSRGTSCTTRTLGNTAYTNCD